MGNTNCENCGDSAFSNGDNHPATITISNDLEELIRQFRERHISRATERKIKSEKFLPENSQDRETDGYKEIINDRKIFLGFFKKNYPEGEGLMIKNESEYYVGLFSNGKPHRRGYQKTQDFQFDGIFLQGKFDHGVIKTKNYTYKGSFQNNKFQGQGSLSFSTGESYQGTFRDGKFHGNGEYMTNNGKYVGMMRNGVYHGLGTYEWKDNSIYDGEYRNGKRHGFGRYIRGEYCFEGIWEEGRLSSKGQEVDKFLPGMEEQKVRSVL